LLKEIAKWYCSLFFFGQYVFQLASGLKDGKNKNCLSTCMLQNNSVDLPKFVESVRCGRALKRFFAHRGFFVPASEFFWAKSPENW
jgi:hypothetical protein